MLSRSDSKTLRESSSNIKLDDSIQNNENIGFFTQPIELSIGRSFLDLSRSYAVEILNLNGIAVACSPAVDDMFINGAMFVDHNRAINQEDVDSIKEIMDKHQIKAFMFVQNPQQQKENADILSKNGINHLFSMKGMALEVDKIPNEIKDIEDFHITEVDNDNDCEDFTKVYIKGFESPPFFYDFHVNFLKNSQKYWQKGSEQRRIIHFVGRYKNEPVACASVTIPNNSKQNNTNVIDGQIYGIGGLYNVAVLGEMRGKGMGKNITLVALRRYKEEIVNKNIGTLTGTITCKASEYPYNVLPHVVLVSSPAGEPVYSAIGFKPYFDIHYSGIDPLMPPSH